MIEIKAISPGESVTEVILSRWFKPNGAWVQKDEKIAEIESDKAALEVYAEVAGRIETLVPEGSTVPVGAVIARIDPQAAPGNGTPPPATPEKKEAPAATAPQPAAPTHVMPSAARILAEKGLSPQEVPATGPGGRLTKADALAAPAKPAPAPAQETTVAPASPLRP
jgi:2-oxoglutarate dehydrogenase E2 component (dihydrolipoamide succinyltransferase)